MMQIIASKSNIMAPLSGFVIPVEATRHQTYIGKTNKGFSFLGYFLQPGKRLQGAKKTLNNCAQRISQLYEQGASKQRTAGYVRYFLAWAKGGFSAQLVSDSDVYSRLNSSLSCPWPFSSALLAEEMEPRIDTPLDVPSVNWKKQKKGVERCGEYCLGYVPSGYLD